MSDKKELLSDLNKERSCILMTLIKKPKKLNDVQKNAWDKIYPSAVELSENILVFIDNYKNGQYISSDHLNYKIDRLISILKNEPLNFPFYFSKLEKLKRKIGVVENNFKVYKVWCINCGEVFTTTEDEIHVCTCEKCRNICDVESGVKDKPEAAEIRGMLQESYNAIYNALELSVERIYCKIEDLDDLKLCRNQCLGELNKFLNYVHENKKYDEFCNEVSVNLYSIEVDLLTLITNKSIADIISNELDNFENILEKKYKGVIENE